MKAFIKSTPVGTRLCSVNLTTIADNGQRSVTKTALTIKAPKGLS